MNGSRKGGLFVEHQCPQCGAPVTLEETSRFFQCGFCRVRLYILARDLLRYTFQPKDPSGEEILYVPYWRFRGMHFSVVPYDVRGKVIDMSFLAAEQKFMPQSLGLRSQALRLRFATSGMKARFLAPGLSFKDIISRVEEGSHFTEKAPSSGRAFHKAFIGETVSMIYTPICIKGRGIYDAVLNRPIAAFSTLRAEALAGSLDIERDWRTEFVSALCPQCGWDLEGGRDSVALFCRNCDRGWHVSGGRFRQLPFVVFPSSDRNAVFFPFWRMSVNVEGLKAGSYADLIRIANLPKAIRQDWEKKVIYFWFPAFKVAPRLYLRLAKQMTVLQPKEQGRERLPGGPLLPVTLSAEEAFEASKVTIAGIANPKKRIFPVLPDVEVTHKKSVLAYFPFIAGTHDFIQPSMKFSIQRNALRGSQTPLSVS